MERRTRSIIGTSPVFIRHLRACSTSIPHRLAFRHASDAHTLNDALPVSEVGWIAAGSTSAEPAQSEVRIERKSRLRRRPRFLQRAEQRQTGGKMEMRQG